MQALLIPVSGPLQEIETVPGLAGLQKIVGGNIEAVVIPEFADRTGQSTGYINEEGKYMPHEKEDGSPGFGAPNMRATDFMVPGVGMFPGDYVAGPFLLCGFDPRTGEHDELPQSIIDRARLIEQEAGI